MDVTHTDQGALCWLQSMGVTTFLDVGCSIGGQVELAVKMGLDAYGIDGDYSLLNRGLIKIPERIYFTDFTKTAALLPLKFDAVWCVEVAEHIQEDSTPNLLKTLSQNLKTEGYLIFTANEGPGIHHVNLKPPAWWKEALAKYDLVEDQLLTEELKKTSTMKREFIKTTGAVFVRRMG